MWYTYILQSKESDKLYVGSTNDLRRRFAEHQRGKTHTTLRLGKIDLIYYEACLNKKDAQAREKQLKTGFGRGYLKRRLRNFFEGP